MDFKSACVVLCAVLTVCSAAFYEYIPGIEYDGEIYVPLNLVSGVRVARSAYPDPRRHHGFRGHGFGGEAQANSNAEAGSLSGPYGSGSAAKADSSAIAQGGGFNFPDEYNSGRGFPGGAGENYEHGGGNAPFYPGQGGVGFPGGPGFENNVGGGTAKAGASGGTDATANANTQTFVGQGYTATSSSSSSSSHTQPGVYGGGGSQAVANAEAVAAS